MEELGWVYFLTLTLLAALPAAQTVDIPTDFAIGGSLVLIPPKTVKKNVVWKHGVNLVVEWVSGTTDYYGSFRGRSTLDTTTGRLEIKKMTKEDEGVYTVEIDYRVLDENYIAKIPNEVPTPEVVFKPLSCSSREENCTLSCEGDTTGAGRVTYSWKMGEGDWMTGEKNINFFKTEVQHIKTITCRMENVVGRKESKPKDNPFITEEEDHTAKIVGGVVGVLILGCIACVGWCKREWFKQKLCADSPRGENEGKSSANPTEVVQLRPGNNAD